MFSGLLHAHSGIRWIILIAIVLAIIIGFVNRKSSGFKSRPYALTTLIASHIQLLIGIALYFMSPYIRFDSEMFTMTRERFFTIEHAMLMLSAVVLITIGWSKAKRSQKSDYRIFVFYLVALVLILMGIPWPGTAYGGSWF